MKSISESIDSTSIEYSQQSVFKLMSENPLLMWTGNFDFSILPFLVILRSRKSDWSLFKEQNLSLEGLSFSADHPELTDFIKEVVQTIDGAPVFDDRFSREEEGWFSFVWLVQLAEDFPEFWIENHLPELVDDLVLWNTMRTAKRSGDSMVSPHLGQLMLWCLDRVESADVYNPFAGVASFGIKKEVWRNMIGAATEADAESIYKKYRAGAFHFKSYRGQELNPSFWALGNLRLIAHSKNAPHRLELEDVFANWDKNASVIISAPPLGYKLSDEQKKIAGTNQRTAVGFVVENVIENITTTTLREPASNQAGKAVLLVSEGFLTNQGSEEKLRKKLIENDLLESVIVVPSGELTGTSIKSSILVLNTKKHLKGTVRMLDASQDLLAGNERGLSVTLSSIVTLFNRGLAHQYDDGSILYVKTSQIGENDYDLNPSRYEGEMEPINTYYPVIRLGDSLKPIKSKTVEIKAGVVTRKVLERWTPFKEIAKHFSSNNSGFTNEKAKKIEESALLVSLQGKNIKFRCFLYDGKPLYISPNIEALSLDTDIWNPKYLEHSFWWTAKVDRQLKAFRKGTLNQHIPLKDFLKLKVELPPVEIQEHIAGSLYVPEYEVDTDLSGPGFGFTPVNHHLIEEATVEVNRLKKELETARDEASFLRHSIAGSLNNVSGALKKIERIVLEQIMNEIPQVLSRKPFEETELTLKDYLHLANESIGKARKVAKTALKTADSIKEKSLYKMRIIPFLRDYAKVRNATETTCDVLFDFDSDALAVEGLSENDLLIDANEELLTDMLDNFLSNAKKHAFEKASDSDPRLFELYLSFTGDDTACLVITNTGLPLPKGFTIQDFTMKGLKSGDSEGDGFGGWYINEIVKHFNGDLAEMTDETGVDKVIQGVTTSFEIDFPLQLFNN